MRVRLLFCLVLVLPGLRASAAPEGDAWDRAVGPALEKHCLKCHAGVRQAGGLDLRSLETMLRGGDRGPAIVPGKPDQSRLVQFVLPGASVHMPPDPKKQLLPDTIAALRGWVAQMPVRHESETAAAYRERYEKSRSRHPLPPYGKSVSATIDWFLEQGMRRAGVVPAALADDATFLRRVTLDLAGRIPTLPERVAFLAETHPDRRERLVDSLLASDAYARRLREVFDTVLMGRAPSAEAHRRRAECGWHAFLEDAFASDRPWNEVVRDLLVARGRGASWFLAERGDAHQKIAEAVAPVVFGVNIGCAQCHNHPLAYEIEQRHYWGLVAAFNRSKRVETDAGPGVAESAIGGFVNFANLKKESQPAALVFLDGKSVPERRPAPEEKEVDRPELYLVAPPAKLTVPKFSRRVAFADTVTNDNPRLARAQVNRLWAFLMGRGLVPALDQLDSRHRASHPELLDWLADEFARGGYRVRPLVRALVLTRAYQRDSRPAGKRIPRPETFARALEKPLTGEQLLGALASVTGAGAIDPGTERAFVTAFPELAPEVYNPTLQQALFLTNSPLVDRLLRPAADALAAVSDEARIETAFTKVLGRAPDAAEKKQCRALLLGVPPARATRRLLWALVTSAEFLVNH